MLLLLGWTMSDSNGPQSSFLQIMKGNRTRIEDAITVEHITDMFAFVLNTVFSGLQDADYNTFNEWTILKLFSYTRPTGR